MQKQSPFLVISTFIVLVALAAALRFYGLGTWSHGFDELYTTMEARLHFEGKPVPPYMYKGDYLDPEKSQFYRLPKLIVASHFVHWIDYRLFGDDEFGSRVLMAVMGSLGVGIVFLLGRPLFGFSGSLILALLILFWPTHVLQSQDNRFSSQAFLLISLLLLLGGHVAVRRSVAAALWLGPVAVLMVLSHSLAGLIWGFLLLGLLIDFLYAKRTDSSPAVFPWKIAVILGLWSILLLGIAVVHILPLAKSWNDFPTSNVSPVHAVICLALSLGWSFFLLCIPATFLTLCDIRKPGQGYWSFCSIACGLSIFLLPLKIPFIAHYTFLFSFPFFVVLALFFERIYRMILQSDIRYARLFGILWLSFVVLASFPSLAGYYQNGDRYDYRSAYQYVQKHWQPGDRLACNSLLTANRYAPELEPKVQMQKNDAEYLQEILDGNIGGSGRLWIVLEFDRYDPTMEIRRWLYGHAGYEARFGEKRLDFKEFQTLEVFLCPVKNKESGRQ